MRLKSALIAAVLALFSLSVAAQTPDQASVDITGNIQKTTTGDGVRDAATISGGLVMNYQHHFRVLPHADSVEANLGFTTFTQYYNPGASQTQSNAYEGTLAYVHHFGNANGESHFRPFVEGGGGYEMFTVVGTGSVTGSRKDGSAAILYGGGLDYGKGSHLALRLGYRGLFYQAPSFSLPQQVTNAWTHMAEPYIGVSYRF